MGLDAFQVPPISRQPARVFQTAGLLSGACLQVVWRLAGTCQDPVWSLSGACLAVQTSSRQFPD
eukprot:1732343-Lingulodinium_polyedra.AAC.1